MLLIRHDSMLPQTATAAAYDGENTVQRLSCEIYYLPVFDKLKADEALVYRAGGALTRPRYQGPTLYMPAALSR